MILNNKYMETNERQRLRSFIEYINLSNREFEINCSISNGYVSKDGNIRNDIRERILAAYPELNRTWLLTGDGEMINTSNTSINKVELGVNSFLVPCLPLRAEAGSLSGFSASVMPYESSIVASPIPGADFAIDIHGDSMEPEYPSGCRVYIQKTELDLVKEGYDYVFDTTDGIILKEVVKINNDSITYHSLNPKYADKDLALADIHGNGIYRVLGCTIFK